MPNERAKITLSGDKELRKLFEELPKRVIKKGLRQAITAAAMPIVRDARGRVERESGLLRKAINKKVKTYKSGNVVAVIGANKAITGTFKGKPRVPSKYISLVEGGTVPHDEPNNPRMKRHPGAKAHPFLKPAYEAQKANAVAIASGKLKSVVEAEAVKLGVRK